MVRFARHPVTLLVALALGIWLAAASDHQFTLKAGHVVGLTVIAVASLVPAVRSRIDAALNAVRQPTPRTRILVAICVGAAAFAYLLGTALAHERVLIAKGHDESSYIIQARILATGRLWMPYHPLADFLESFHLLTRPVYAPIYFPGTALMNVPMAWLDLPVHVIPLILAAAIVGLTYRIVTEVVDGVAGLLAALLLLSAYWFRVNATLVMAQSPTMLLGLLMIWAWLRWRKSPTWQWAVAIGALAGWAAITRPVDALCFALPIGIAMFIQLLRGPGKQWLTTAAPIVLAAVPFFTLQLTLNHGTTGSLLKSPYVAYLEHSQPATSYGYHEYDPAVAPKSHLLQKHMYYDRFLRDAMKAQQTTPVMTELNWRLWRTAEILVPWRVLLVLVPIGLLGLIRSRRENGGQEAWCDVRLIVLLSVYPLFIGLYLPNAFFLEHYCIPLLAPASLLVVLGIDVVRLMRGPEFVRAGTMSFLTLSTGFLAIAALPEFNTQVNDNFFKVPERVRIEQLAQTEIRTPAVLFIRFDGRNNMHDEPVYNTDVAWPDDAEVVRLHDLGLERDIEAAEYYAKHQPERNIYLYDRLDGTLFSAGKAPDVLIELRARLQAARTTNPTTRDAPVSQPATAPIIEPNLSQEH